jgi:hypothetical protein
VFHSCVGTLCVLPPHSHMTLQYFSQRNVFDMVNNSDNSLKQTHITECKWLSMKRPVCPGSMRGFLFLPVPEVLNFIHTLTGLRQCIVQQSSPSLFHSSLENG